jgi:SAM-dependent methyltransferase
VTDHPHEHWETRFRAEPHYLFGTAPSRFLTDNPWIVMSDARVLCVADGEGRNGVHLARAGMQVTSFDVSATAVERARRLAADHKVPLDAQVGGWDDWDWQRPFDVIVGVFIQFADPTFRARQFADMTRALVPGGRLALHGYTVEQLALGTGGPRDPSHLYTESLLRDAFVGWHIERCAAYECELQEGRAHCGRSALIDFVARKPGA